MASELAAGEGCLLITVLRKKKNWRRKTLQHTSTSILAPVVTVDRKRAQHRSAKKLLLFRALLPLQHLFQQGHLLSQGLIAI